MKNCPCCSGKLYNECCAPFHHGKQPQTAVELMRARFAAYAQNLPSYIMQTTHPASSEYAHNKSGWSQEISDFCKNSRFLKLEILGVEEHGDYATVTFFADVKQQGEEASFTERSSFEKVKGKWLYRGGILSDGHAPNLATLSQKKLLPLAYYDDPILRKKAAPIEEITPELRKLVDAMVETMDGCDGMGLAAPQVHHSIRLFVIRKPSEETDGVELGEVKVFINPSLSAPSEEAWKANEGCLSIPSIRGSVERPREITVEYTNLEGKRITERVSGWEARVIMHENDHINGTLFIDRVSKKERQKIDPFLQAVRGKIHDGTEL